MKQHSNILEQIKFTYKKYIVGIDETGWGSLCADLYVCAFCAERDWTLDGLNDSKKLSSKKRELLSEKLKNEDTGHNGFAISRASAKELDNLGAGNTLRKLYKDAIDLLVIKCNIDINECLIVIDGKMKIKEYEHLSLPKADSLITQVMAASIIAKVDRDDVMKELDLTYPEYKWCKNKGYGSREHLDALHKYGYTDLHRRTYEPIKSMLK